ncbi:MAG: arginase family protein [Ardenticatenaceae bacterium]|nr:arginase family protein [Ardenticatenaceae bacterium]
MSAAPFALVGVPIDCSGRATGVERMPQALRAANLVGRLHMPDLGDWPVGIHDAVRDPATGIIGFRDVCLTASTVRDGVLAVWRQGQRPFLIGGCCTLLIGVGAAIKQQYGTAGLAFVDGHLDFYDGRSSPTGEAADMELAILTGHGPAGLVDLAGEPPLLRPEYITVLGYRDGALAAQEGAPDPAQVVPQMRLLDVTAVRHKGFWQTGKETAVQFAKNPGRFWLHIDLDVLDETALPAVDYPMPGGLQWHDLSLLLTPLARSPHLIGVDVTIYNPVLDVEAAYASRIVNLLCELFS